MGAAVHRAWIDTKLGLGGGGKTILEPLERGEDSAKEDCEKALSGSLPSNIYRNRATSGGEHEIST